MIDSISNIQKGSFQTTPKESNINQKPITKEIVKEVHKQPIKNEYAKQEVSQKDLKDLVKFLNQIPIFKDSLNFGFSDDLGQLLVQITDKKTNEVIRQYPSEEFINRAMHYKDNIGVLLDENS